MKTSRSLYEYPSPEAEQHAKAFLSGDQGMSFGPYILSLWLNGLLLGVLLQQSFTWIRFSRKSERRFISVLVCLVLFGSLVDSVLYLLITYVGGDTNVSISTLLLNMRLFAYNFGNYAPFQSTKWLGWPPVIDGFVGVACQTFYVERAYKLNNRMLVIPIVAGTLMLACIAGALATLISFWELRTESEAGRINHFVSLWLSTTIALDLIIVILVGRGLWKSKTGWSKTDALIKKLLIYSLSLETQLGPTIVTLAWLITFSIDPPSSLGVFFSFTQSKVYAVALFAVLNSRIRLSLDTSSEKLGLMSNSYTLSSPPVQQKTVSISHETYTESYYLKTPDGSPNRDLHSVREYPDLENGLEYSPTATEGDSGNPPVSTGKTL